MNDHRERSEKRSSSTTGRGARPATRKEERKAPMSWGDAIPKQARKRYSFLSENDKKSYTLKERIRCSENRVKTNSVLKRKVKMKVVKLARQVRVQAIYHTFVLSSLYAVSLYVSMKSALTENSNSHCMVNYVYKERALTAVKEYIHS